MATEYIFSGNVQGVGFRFQTASLARKYAVTGFVRNLGNGDVQLVVDGSPAAVTQFVSAVQAAMANYIGSVDRRELDTHERLTSFDIRYERSKES
jgi:acylphosphatase